MYKVCSGKILEQKLDACHSCIDLILARSNGQLWSEILNNRQPFRKGIRYAPLYSSNHAERTLTWIKWEDLKHQENQVSSLFDLVESRRKSQSRKIAWSKKFNRCFYILTPLMKAAFDLLYAHLCLCFNEFICGLVM